jgi:hypothetical protein
MAHFAKQNAAMLGGGLFLRFEANWKALRRDPVPSMQRRASGRRTDSS